MAQPAAQEKAAPAVPKSGSTPKVDAELQAIDDKYNRDLVQLDQRRLAELGLLAATQRPDRAAATYERLFRLAITADLFRDAENLRKQMGDDRFFGTLGEGSSADSEFGDVDRQWDAERFETAIVVPPGSEERSQLISVLIGKFFGSYDTQAGAHGEAFLSLDKGLSVLSKHAAGLGYDGLILFLDELVLWLASHAADLKFVHQEGQKLAKLVEELRTFSPLAQRTAKKLLNDTEDSTLSIAIELEGHCYSRLRQSDDFKEGVEAFHARRPAKFKGS